MLALRPIPEPCEPPAVKRVRIALRAASDHPDALAISKACDVLAHAILRLREIAETMHDAEVRECIEATPHGSLSNLDDSLSDMGYALECWREQNQSDNERAVRAEMERWA
jgi:hypothetical protein